MHHPTVKHELARRFSDWICTLRIRWDRKEFAALVGTNEQYVRLWERGTVIPRAGDLQSICKALDFDFPETARRLMDGLVELPPEPVAAPSRPVHGAPGLVRSSNYGAGSGSCDDLDPVGAAIRSTFIRVEENLTKMGWYIRLAKPLVMHQHGPVDRIGPYPSRGAAEQAVVNLPYRLADKGVEVFEFSC